MKIAVILLAAGSGLRMGEKTPKQFLPIFKKPLFLYSLETFGKLPTVHRIVLVGSKQYRRRYIKYIPQKYKSKIILVDGGSFRGESVSYGYAALEDSYDVVLVHDSARPFITGSMVQNVADEAKKNGAALLAIPVSDTLKNASSNCFVQHTVPRKKLWAAQTPQGFRWDIAKKCLNIPSMNATDDVELAERKGFKVKLVMGSPRNFKVTRPDDLIICQAFAKIKN
ncbi:MAG: 2-C-methyl-D-erythritol 4-phosphate cytidylyltransferase [Elusimicrobiota bacterium]